MDSKLVVEQMSGRWKIKHEDMRRLALEARELCAAISDAGGSVDFEWVPRESKKAADALSNDAMDGTSVTLEVSPGVHVRYDRRAIGMKVPSAQAPAPEQGE